MTRVHDNPLSIVAKEERHPANQLSALVFPSISPLDSADSLRLAIHNIKLAINGCRHWQSTNCNDDGTLREGATYEMLHSFEMERNCLQLLAGLYEERLLLTEDGQKCI